MYLWDLLRTLATEPTTTFLRNGGFGWPCLSCRSRGIRKFKVPGFKFQVSSAKVLDIEYWLLSIGYFSLLVLILNEISYTKECRSGEEILNLLFCFINAIKNRDTLKDLFCHGYRNFHFLKPYLSEKP